MFKVPLDCTHKIHCRILHISHFPSNKQEVEIYRKSSHTKQTEKFPTKSVESLRKLVMQQLLLCQPYNITHL